MGLLDKTATATAGEDPGNTSTSGLGSLISTSDLYNKAVAEGTINPNTTLKDFESFVVTDPDLVDPSIDVSGLRTQTDTSPFLLGNIPDYSGIQYDYLAPTKYTDLMRLYSQGLPMFDTSQPATPPSGGGSGDGGQVTTAAPITGDSTTTPIIPIDPGTFTAESLDESFAGEEGPITQPVTGGITGDPIEIGIPDNESGYIDPLITQAGAPVIFDINQTGDPSQNMLDVPTRDVGLAYTGDFDPDDEGTVYSDEVNNALLPPEQQDPGFWETARDNFIQTGQDVGNFFKGLGSQGIDIGKLAGTTILNLAGKAAFGVPLLGTAISLVGNLPPRDPRQTALDEFYTTGEGAQYLDPSSPNYIPGMENYNIVSGSDTLNKLTGDRLIDETTYGLQEAYQDRIDTINESLNKFDKYNPNHPDYDPAKTKELTDRVKNLEDAKVKEKARLDLFSGDVDERDQMLEDISLQNKIDTGIVAANDDSGSEMLDTTPTNITTNITSDQIDEFDTTPQVDTPTGINTGIKLGPRRLDQDLSTLGDDLSAELDDILGNNITGDSTLVADADVITTKLQEQKDKLEGIKNSDAYEFLNQEQKDQLEEDLDKINEDLKLKEIEGQTAGLITMTDATTGDDDLIDTGTVTTGSGNNPFGYTDPTSTFDAEEEDEIYEPPTPPSPPTGTDRPGGDSRDDSPAPSPSPTTLQGVTTSQFQAFRDTGGGGGQDSSSTPSPSAPSQPDYSNVSTGGPPSQSGNGGGGGGGGGGKIVCTMMNESYGFGSFRNKIWLKNSKDMAPEYQKGYHKIFLPLVKIAKTNKIVKKTLEHIAVHRTIDIRQESRGKVHLLGRVYRKILEPICYIVGKYAK
jgi:hypothetical protein